MKQRILLSLFLACTVACVALSGEVRTRKVRSREARVSPVSLMTRDGAMGGANMNASYQTEQKVPAVVYSRWEAYRGALVAGSGLWAVWYNGMLAERHGNKAEADRCYVFMTNMLMQVEHQITP